MTAQTVINQIKALPASELAEVIDFVRGLKSEREAQTTDPKFSAAAEKVFGRHEELMRRLSQ